MTTRRILFLIVLGIVLLFVVMVGITLVRTIVAGGFN